MFFTLEPSDHVDQQADDDDGTSLWDGKFAEIRDLCPWVDQYAGKSISLGGAKISFEDSSLKRGCSQVRLRDCAYDLACQSPRVSGRPRRRGFRNRTERRRNSPSNDHDRTLRDCRSTAARGHRTRQSSASAGRRLRKRESTTRATSLALESSLSEHAAIARELGPYKVVAALRFRQALDLSRAGPRHRRHVPRQNGWHQPILEAVRVAARVEPMLFRRIVDFSRNRF